MTTSIQLLMAMTNDGEYSVKAIVKKIEDWELDPTEVMEAATSAGNCPTANSLFLEIYRMHAEDIKESIGNILEDMQTIDEDIYIDKEKLKGYEVPIDINGIASSYNSQYTFWNADNIYDLTKNYLNEVIEFLVSEIVMVEDACEKLELADEDCNKNEATTEVLKRVYKELNKDEK